MSPREIWGWFGFWLGLSLAACAGAGAHTAPIVREPGWPADSVREESIAPGVLHRRLRDSRGPWAIHVIEVDPHACGVEFRTAKAGDQVVGRETVSALARRAEERLARPVLAAINGDFFSFEPPGVPEGPQVSAGEVIKSEGTHREANESRRLAFQPVFGVSAEGVPFIAEMRLEGEVWSRSGPRAPLRALNAKPRDEGVALYNHWIGAATPADTSATELLVRLLTPPHLAGAGDPTRGVVLGLDTAAAGVALPQGGAVLAGKGPAAVALLRSIAAGDTVIWKFGFPPLGATPKEMIGGFPLLLRSGETVLERETELRPPFSDVRHPRAAVGLTARGIVLLVTVDGRQPGYSEGMTLAEFADLLRSFGATDALNLDGGGSTTLLVGGQTVNRPSDKTGARPVANALLVLGPAAGKCPPSSVGLPPQ